MNPKLLTLLIVIAITNALHVPDSQTGLKSFSFSLTAQNPIELGHMEVTFTNAPVVISGSFFDNGQDQYPYQLKFSEDQGSDQENLISGQLKNSVKLTLKSKHGQVECLFENSDDTCTIENPAESYEATIQCINQQQSQNSQCSGRLFVEQALSAQEHRIIMHRQASNLTLKEQLKQIIKTNVQLFNNGNSNKGGDRDVQLFFEQNKISLAGPQVQKFAWDWQSIKEKFPQYMKDFFELRKRTVDQLLDKIFTKFADCKIIQGKQTVNVCKATSSGSVGAAANLLSDYDLTVTGNFKVSEMIQLFNTAILNYFGNYPFQAFDSNLYGYSFMFPLTPGFKHNITWPVDDVQGLYNYLTNPVDVKYPEQDIWAYNRLQNLKQDDHTVDRMTFSCQKCNNWLKSNNLSQIDTKSKSQKYLVRMKVFETLMKKYPDNAVSSFSKEKILDIKKQMIESLSHMNYYGDATYFTQGTFAHVIGTMFYYKNNPNSEKVELLSKRQLLHSLVENLGYFIHAYEHKDIVYAIKYLERFLDALILVEYLEEIDDDTTAKLQELKNLAGFIKSKVRNLSNKEMYDKLKTTPEYKDRLAKFEPFKETPEINQTLNAIRKQIAGDFQTKFKSYLESKGFKIDEDNIYVYGMARFIKKVIDQNPQITDLRINEISNKFDVNIQGLGEKKGTQPKGQPKGQPAKNYQLRRDPSGIDTPQNFKVGKSNKTSHRLNIAH